MWDGPYGDGGSRKYLVASCDQSLQRLGLEYVDIFYSHRYDSKTPLEETMGALDTLVRSGKALYVGISSYPPEQTRQAADILKQLGTPCLIHQPSYSLLNRGIEDGLLDVLSEKGIGCIAFCPLQQGILTDKYLGRHSRRFARRQPARQFERGKRQTRRNRESPPTQRNRARAKSKHGADGARLGFAPKRHDKRLNRRF